CTRSCWLPAGRRGTRRWSPGMRSSTSPRFAARSRPRVSSDTEKPSSTSTPWSSPSRNRARPRTPSPRFARRIGRGINFPIAMEGALKLKEISYVHAEGYAAGELKHGPIALLEPDVPVIATATRSATLPKMVSNVQEVHSRDAPVIALITEGEDPFDAGFATTIPVPGCSEVLSPLINVIPLQLFAYHVAVQRGCDVDQPRNLAKSVTVE